MHSKNISSKQLNYNKKEKNANARIYLYHTKANATNKKYGS